MTVWIAGAYVSLETDSGASLVPAVVTYEVYVSQFVIATSRSGSRDMDCAIRC